MFHLNKGLWALGIPFAISYVAVIRPSVTIFVLFIAAHFLILKITPVFKNYENIGMFVMLVFSTIPVNIYIFKLLGGMGLLFDSLLVMNILRGTLYYIVLLSLEEIIMGTLTRWIWKNQHKSFV